MDDLERFRRALRISAVVITAVYLLGLGLTDLIGNRDTYRSFAVQLTAYGALAAILATDLWRLFRGLAWGQHRWPVLAVVVVAGVLSQAALEPDPAVAWQNWYFGLGGWFAVLLLFECRISLLGGFLLLYYGAVLVRLLLLQPSPATLSGVISGSLVSAGFQLALAGAAVALRAVAREAAVARRDAEAIELAEAVAAGLHADRRRRHADLSAGAGPLLTGLADRVLDPEAPDVQRRCAIEASRMRRTFAEADEVEDPLLHELTACADLAERRGVGVSVATNGAWPTPPLAVRRALIDGALAALATARTVARVAVTGVDGTVSVSVVADCDPIELPRPDSHGVEIDVILVDGQLWVEAQWRTKRSSP